MDMRKLGRRSALAVAIASIALTGCDSGDDSSSSTVINLSGGAGGLDGAVGGRGGWFSFENYTGTGSLVTLERSGKADAGFDKADITVELGSNPLEITANTTIAVVTEAPATGVPYMVLNNSNVFISDGDTDEADETPVTGIHVAKGKTLTLELNEPNDVYDNRFSTTVPGALINLSHDFHNQGTVTTDDGVYGPGSLDIYAEVYVGTGTVDLEGRADGDYGGNFFVNADTAILSEGKIVTSGRNSTEGNAGAAGYIDFESDLVQNYASVTANGGSSTADDGNAGDAGAFYMYSYGDGTYNAGNVVANGGSAANDAGDGGALYLGASYGGDVYNQGDITANGGSSLTRSGASGGYFGTSASGGDIVNSGGVVARGGKTASADDETTYYGGYGGGVYAYVSDSLEDGPVGDVTWSGKLDLRGGDALAAGTANGGNGGSFDVLADVRYDPTGSDILLLGYDLIKADGGDGDWGGDAGYGGIINGTADFDEVCPPDASCTYTYETGGSVLASIGLSAVGGDASPKGTSEIARGGFGGDFEVMTGQTDSDADYETAGVTVDFTGDIDVRSGTSRNYNESDLNGGGAEFYGASGVSVVADIIADGGRDIGKTTGTGASGGWATFGSAYGDITVKGKLNANGAYGALLGGDGGMVMFYPEDNDVVFTGSIKVNAGDADSDLVSVGGDGGYACGYTELFDGVLEYALGTGATDGEEGDADLIGGMMP